MSDLKQVIVLRKDLNMRKGKMAAQASHASMAFLSEALIHTHAELAAFKDHTPFAGKNAVLAALTDVEQAWLQGIFKKIVVGVDSEDELLELYYLAVTAKVTAHIIQDAGLTEFKEPTYTAIALGPDHSEVLDEITGHLKLL